MPLTGQDIYDWIIYDVRFGFINFIFISHQWVVEGCFRSAWGVVKERTDLPTPSKGVAKRKLSPYYVYPLSGFVPGVAHKYISLRFRQIQKLLCSDNISVYRNSRFIFDTPAQCKKKQPPWHPFFRLIPPNGRKGRSRTDKTIRAANTRFTARTRQYVIPKYTSQEKSMNNKGMRTPTRNSIPPIPRRLCFPRSINNPDKTMTMSATAKMSENHVHALPGL